MFKYVTRSLRYALVEAAKLKRAWAGVSWAWIHVKFAMGREAAVASAKIHVAVGRGVGRLSLWEKLD